MPKQHKMAPECCQAACRCFSACLSRRRASNSAQSHTAAALGRRATLIGLLLSAYAVILPPPRAEASGKRSESFRTADHLQVSAVRAGDVILVRLQIDQGYHINANPASSDYLIPTSLAFEGVAPERIAYPPATRLKPAFADDPIAVYDGMLTIAAIFSPGVLDRQREINLTVTAQACTEQICLPPDDITGKASW